MICSKHCTKLLRTRIIIGRVGTPYRGRNSFCICEEHMPPQIAMIQMAMPPQIAIFQMAMPPHITRFPYLALSSQVRSAGVKALGMEIPSTWPCLHAGSCDSRDIRHNSYVQPRSWRARGSGGTGHRSTSGHARSTDWQNTTSPYAYPAHHPYPPLPPPPHVVQMMPQVGQGGGHVVQVMPHVVQGGSK